MSAHYDLTPTERQAGMIADLEARLELMNERLFYVSAELAKARAQSGGRQVTLTDEQFNCLTALIKTRVRFEQVPCAITASDLTDAMVALHKALVPSLP